MLSLWDVREVSLHTFKLKYASFKHIMHEKLEGMLANSASFNYLLQKDYVLLSNILKFNQSLRDSCTIRIIFVNLH